MLTNIDESVSPLDTKARRKAQDVRRMRYRRAIESYAEQRRLQALLDPFAEPSALTAQQAWVQNRQSVSPAH
ncbi:hypothetical protein QK899_19770 [Pseudomonas sp. AR5]|nr:hypothetical protein QK899_19770 [Pseudomonas sp. AR5]